MTYLSGKLDKRRNYTKYALYFSVFLVLVIAWPGVKKYSYKVLEPFVMRYGITKQSFVIFPEFFGTYLVSHQTLALKNKNLEAEIEVLKNALADKDADLREKIFADTPLGSTSTRGTSPLLLYPVMEDVTKLYSTIVFSRGFKDGIDIGDMVYVQGNQAVCVIKEVYNSSSLCLLLTSSGFVSEGVTSSSSVVLSLVGRGGHYLANIVRDTPVSVGETVYMRSNPRVILGTVKEVANNNQDTSWHVFVEGAYNPVMSSVFYVQP